MERVTHNDTKINSVLFNRETDEALVIVDLDTVMLGLIGHDFGDGVRFAANRVEEDYLNAEEAECDMERFRRLRRAFFHVEAIQNAVE